MAVVELDEKVAAAWPAAAGARQASTWRCEAADEGGQGGCRKRPHHGARNGARWRC